jgi:hypothetical protein
MRDHPYAAGEPQSRIEYLLLLEEVRGVVGKFAADGGTLRIGAHAKRLRTQFEGSGIPQGVIADELLLTAAQAGVPVEIDSA